MHGGDELVRYGNGENGYEHTGADRWNAALTNMTEMGSSIELLQRLLLHKAVYMDEEAFGRTASSAHQARNTMVQERRIKALEKELDAAVSAARHAKAEEMHAESAQRAAEAHCQEIIQELENTTEVFKVHMEEFRSKQSELAKKDSEIQLLKAIIEAMGKGDK